MNYDNENKILSNSCKDLIQKLLNANPQKRLKLKDILEHPFIKKYSKKLLYVKKSSAIINEDKIKNQLSKNMNDINNNSKKVEFNENKIITNNKRLKKANTLNINSNNE